MIAIKRRNLSSMARRYARARGIIVSIPKSGRTWLRVFLYAYCCALEGRPFTLDEEEISAASMPQFIFTHDLWEHLKTARFKDSIRGKHLVPRHAVDGKPILLLSRDPRDVIVSLFFQLSKRTRQFGGNLSDIINDRRFGIHSIVEIMNTWLLEWGEKDNCKLLRYEDCRLNTRGAFEEMLKFFGFDRIERDAFDRSLQFSSFDNMKNMEARGEFKAGILMPENPLDPDSFKVRRGIVGGYKQYLNERDLRAIEEAMRSLDARFGYQGSRLAAATPAVE
jgi:hypothetical protein